MAGSEPPQAAGAPWRVRESRDTLLIANPYGGDAATVRVPLQACDPYFAWAVGNGGRRLAQVLPSRPPTRGHLGDDAPPIDCAPTTYKTPAAFLQVLIQVATGLAADTEADARRRAALDEHQRISQGGLRVRGAFKQPATGAPRLLADACFVTGIVADWWLICFLKRIGAECVRWEIGHARTSVEPKPPTKPPGGQPLTEQEMAWDPADELLDGDVMVIIDHGCPFAHPAFRDDAGRSRVRYAWFQGGDSLAPLTLLPHVLRHGGGERLFPYGMELRGSRIDQLIAAHGEGGPCDEAACYEAVGYELMREASTHGAHVMSIACGAPNPLAREPGEDWLCGTGWDGDIALPPNDRASRASIVFIELPRQTVGDSSGGAMNVHLVDALHYVLQRTRPTAHVTVNCSFGTHGGPHDGSSLLEQALASALESRPQGVLSLVVPIGNAYNSACHASAKVTPAQPLQARIDIPADKTTDTFIEVWFPSRLDGEPGEIDVADLTLELTTPAGQALRPTAGNTCACWFAPGAGNVPSVTVVQVGRATATRHRMLVVVAPTAARPDGESASVAPYGHWGITLRSGRSGAAVLVDLWIERDDPIFEPPMDRQARFVTYPPQRPAPVPSADPADEYPAPRDGPVSKGATYTSYCTTRLVYAAGGYVRPTLRDARLTADGQRPLLASYSSAGAEMPHLSTNKPEVLAAVEDSAVLPGRLAAGNQGRRWVRRNGTSVAAPQFARRLLNADGDWGGLPTVEPNIEGERGDGLSLEGEALQFDRVGLGQILRGS